VNAQKGGRLAVGLDEGKIRYRQREKERERNLLAGMMPLVRFGSSALLHDGATVYEWARENERCGWGIFSRRGRKGEEHRAPVSRSPIGLKGRFRAEPSLEGLLAGDLVSLSPSFSLSRVISHTHQE